MTLGCNKHTLRETDFEVGFGCAGFMKKPRKVDEIEPVLMPRIVDAGLNNIGICASNSGWNWGGFYAPKNGQNWRDVEVDRSLQGNVMFGDVYASNSGQN